MAKIKLLEDFCGMKKGTVKDVADSSAKGVVSRGLAEYVEDKATKTEKEPKKKNEVVEDKVEKGAK